MVFDLKRVSLFLLFYLLSHGRVFGQARIQNSNKIVRQNQVLEHLGGEFVNAGKSDALSVAIVKDGAVSFYNFGIVSRATRTSSNEQTVYEIGSISKLFTSLLLAHAATEGKVSLQDDIRKYLPAGYDNLSFQGTPIRLIDLADNTSALPDNLPDFSEILGTANAADGPAILTKALQSYKQEDMLRDLKRIRLINRPGTAPRHSNLAAEILGTILRNVYGRTYEDLLGSYIERPFKMNYGTGESRVAQLAIGYNDQHVQMPVTNEASIRAAGGLRYSTADMAKFLAAELSTVDRALQLSQKPCWGTPEKAAVAFSWNISRTVDNQLKLQTSGGTLGQSSYIEMYPELHYGIVLLANRSGETEFLLQQLAGKIFVAIEETPALNALRSSLESKRYLDVTRVIADVRKRFPQLHLTEAYVNDWGGSLLGSKRPEAAVQLFKYNTAQWPQSSDALDSLGEGYRGVGDKLRAVNAFRRSLKLNPDNGEAKQALKELEAKTTPPKL